MADALDAANTFLNCAKQDVEAFVKLLTDNNVGFEYDEYHHINQPTGHKGNFTFPDNMSGEEKGRLYHQLQYSYMRNHENWGIKVGVFERMRELYIAYLLEHNLDPDADRFKQFDKAYVDIIRTPKIPSS